MRAPEHISRYDTALPSSLLQLGVDAGELLGEQPSPLLERRELLLQPLAHRFVGRRRDLGALLVVRLLH